MKQQRGFTLIELIVVMAIIAILAVLILMGVGRLRSRAKIARVSAELTDISKAVTQYAQDNNYQYPADTDRDVPPGLEKYLANGTWPESIWPHGVFDWDNWTNASGQQIYQISYRLCGLSDPDSYCSDTTFPFFTRYSSIYYCISDASGGSCQPHRDYPNAPGYCINCKVKKVNWPAGY